MTSQFSSKYRQWMDQAIACAIQSEREGEVPVGAVLVADNKIIAQGWNRPIGNNDPTAHAEIMALRKGAEVLGNYRLTNTTLFVTLEPCAMCAGAIVHARVKHLVFGALDPRSGAVNSTMSILDSPAMNHRVSWQGGLLQEECSLLLTSFFKKRRIRR